MAITSTTSEAKHGNRKTAAKGSEAPALQTPDAGRGGGRDSSSSPKARPVDRSASGGRATSPARSGEEHPEIVLTIDLEEERVLQAVAEYLLDITAHQFPDG
jgi:hypothetical protein